MRSEGVSSADDFGEGTMALESGLERVRVRRATLVLPEGSRVELPAEGLTLGSAEDCDLVLVDEFLSRRHAQLVPGPDVVRLRDLKSKNGTRIGDLQITDVGLRSDTTIVLGKTALRLEFSSEPMEYPVSPRTRFGSAVGSSVSIRAAFALLERASRSDVTVLIEGATGTGKDVLATALHEESHRRAGPFVVVDCGSIPENLIESELFGHQRGAFTGATESRQGAFALADGGTLFLDEIGELPLSMQPKLLRVLETKTFRPIGASQPSKVNVRIVAATNRRLAEAVKAKTFREDLYYRLNVVSVRVPQLRDRREDIELLANTFYRRAIHDEGAYLPANLMALLLSHDWPGNARELRNVVDRFATFDTVERSLLFDENSAAEAHGASFFDSLVGLDYHEGKRRLIDEYHRVVVAKVLGQCGDNVSEAAKRLGIPRTSLHRMLKTSAD